MATAANSNFVITASATGRGNYTGLLMQTHPYLGMRLYVDITVKSSASHKPVFTLQGLIPGTTRFQNLWKSTPASTATQTIKVLVMPGASTTASKSTAMGYTRIINDFLPSAWRFVSTSANSSQGSSKAGTRATWSAGADLVAW